MSGYDQTVTLFVMVTVNVWKRECTHFIYGQPNPKTVNNPYKLL